jgi:hypothetical protein
METKPTRKIVSKEIDLLRGVKKWMISDWDEKAGSTSVGHLYYSNDFPDGMFESAIEHLIKRPEIPLDIPIHKLLDLVKNSPIVTVVSLPDDPVNHPSHYTVWKGRVY